MTSFSTLVNNIENGNKTLNEGVQQYMETLKTYYTNELGASGLLKPLDWVHNYDVCSYDDVVAHLQYEIYSCKPYQSQRIKKLSNILLGVIKLDDISKGCDWFVLKPIENNPYQMLTINDFDKLVNETKQMINYYQHN